MKVLFATIPQPKNNFVNDLKFGIEQGAEVVYDFNEFWDCKNHYDVVHIHEPEYLSFEVEACMNNTDPIPKDLWSRLISCLEHWKKTSKIIHTRHVQEPHVRIDDEFRKLYKTVFSYCDGVAHFAHFSIEQFKSFYPELSHIKHAVIPHQNYLSLPHDVSKVEAREKLGIHQKAKVMLVFGMIKEREKALIKMAFDAIPGNNKVLLAPGWKVARRQVSWIRLREWIYNFELRKAKKDTTFRTNLGFIKDEDAQFYCKSADFIFIPRVNELNSGNITLGFTFGLVVAGRDGGDIGEILKETGNAVFNPDRPESIEQAVQYALDKAAEGLGDKNQKLALDEWGIDKIGNMYLSFFKELQSE